VLLTAPFIGLAIERHRRESAALGQTNGRTRPTRPPPHGASARLR
jgi:hypothetical protein